MFGDLNVMIVKRMFNINATCRSIYESWPQQNFKQIVNKEFVNASCVTTHDTLVSDDQNENMKVGWSLGNGLLLEFHNVMHAKNLCYCSYHNKTEHGAG